MMSLALPERNSALISFHLVRCHGMVGRTRRRIDRLGFPFGICKVLDRIVIVGLNQTAGFVLVLQLVALH